MAITIELPPDVEERVIANARLRGLAVSEYAGELIAGSVPAATRDAFDLPVDEFERLLDCLGQLIPVNAPPIPDEALRRENLYEREDTML